jgi:hypothetical protein
MTGAQYHLGRAALLLSTVHDGVLKQKSHAGHGHRGHHSAGAPCKADSGVCGCGGAAGRQPGAHRHRDGRPAGRQPGAAARRRWACRHGKSTRAITLQAEHASRHPVCAAAAESSRSTTPQQAWLLTAWCLTDAPGVEVDGEVVPADAVVVAMGPWSGQAAKWGLPIPAVRSCFPSPGLNEPLPALSNLLLSWLRCHVAMRSWPCGGRLRSGRRMRLDLIRLLQVGGQKATSIVLRPDADISADMLFLEYRGPSGADIAMAVPALMFLRSCYSTRPSTMLSDLMAKPATFDESTMVNAGRAIAPEVYPRPDGSVYICGAQRQLPSADQCILPGRPLRYRPQAGCVQHNQRSSLIHW